MLQFRLQFLWWNFLQNYRLNQLKALLRNDNIAEYRNILLAFVNMFMEKKCELRWKISLVLPILFVAWCLCRALTTVSPDVWPDGDYLLIGLSVHNSSRFAQLVGPYSRFHFHHPGPISFYLYQLGDRIFTHVPNQFARYSITQLLINSYFLYSGGRAARQLTGSLLSAWLLYGIYGVVILYSGVLSPATLGDIWGPAVVITPLLTLLLGSAALIEGHFSFLVPVILAVVILVSNHLGTLGITALVCAFTAYKVMHRFGLGTIKEHRIPVVICVVMIVVSFTPPLWDAVLHPHGGNLGRIIHFIVTTGSKKTVLSAIEFLSRFFCILPLTDYPLSRIAVFGTELLVVAVLCFRRQEGLHSLALLCAIAAFAAFLSALKIKGAYHPFILWHQYSVATCIIWLILVRGLTFISSHPSLRSLLMIGCVALAFWITFVGTVTRNPISVAFSNSKTEVTSAINNLNLDKNTLYQVRHLRGTADWSALVLVAYGLEELGFRYCVDKKFEFMFGREKICPQTMNKEGQRTLHLYTGKALRNLDTQGLSKVKYFYIGQSAL